MMRLSNLLWTEFFYIASQDGSIVFYFFLEDQDAIFGGKGKWTEFYLEDLVLRFIIGWKRSAAEGQDQG